MKSTSNHIIDGFTKYIHRTLEKRPQPVDVFAGCAKMRPSAKAPTKKRLLMYIHGLAMFLLLVIPQLTIDKVFLFRNWTCLDNVDLSDTCMRYL